MGQSVSGCMRTRELMGKVSATTSLTDQGAHAWLDHVQGLPRCSGGAHHGCGLVGAVRTMTGWCTRLRVTLPCAIGWLSPPPWEWAVATRRRPGEVQPRAPIGRVFFLSIQGAWPVSVK